MSALNPSFGEFVEERPALSRRAAAFARSVPFGIWIASLVVALFLIAAIFPQLLETTNPYNINLAARFSAPSAAHLLGTDQLGRDVFSRIVAGTGESLSIGFGATGIALALALALGLLAGLGGKVGDAIVSRLIDVLFAFPVLFLALMVVTV